MDTTIYRERKPPYMVIILIFRSARDAADPRVGASSSEAVGSDFSGASPAAARPRKGKNDRLVGGLDHADAALRRITRCFLSVKARPL